MEEPCLLRGGGRVRKPAGLGVGSGQRAEHDHGDGQDAARTLTGPNYHSLGFHGLKIQAAAEKIRFQVRLTTLGLPYAADPAVTRHLAAFLARHRAALGEGSAAPVPLAGGAFLHPTAVLFNGGVMKAGRRVRRQNRDYPLNHLYLSCEVAMEFQLKHTTPVTEKTGTVIVAICGEAYTPAARALDDASGGHLTRALKTAGFEGKPGQGEITIHAQDLDRECLVTIEDNGVGEDPERVRRVLAGDATTDSVGLANVDERLRAAFGDEYGLVVETAQGAGTRVVVRLPKFRPGVHV